MVSAQQQQQLGLGSNKESNTKPSHISFEDLSKTMEEFDVVLRRPAFLEEKQLTATTGSGGGSHVNQRPNQSYSSVHTDPSKRFHGEGSASKADAIGGANMPSAGPGAGAMASPAAAGK